MSGEEKEPTTDDGVRAVPIDIDARTLDEAFTHARSVVEPVMRAVYVGTVAVGAGVLAWKEVKKLWAPKRKR